jgi:ethanolamine ammonia-lyase small subunit
VSRDIDKLWERFSSVSRARIALGRVGDALPTDRLLEFDYAHACARDAVLAGVDFAALAAERSVYLRRPDLGRRLALSSAANLSAGPYDAVFVIADGLSAGAVQQHAAPLLRAIYARLPQWRLGPVVLAEQARVALGDEIGSKMDAGMVVMFIGERPGLTVPNSLGIYITYAPQVGRRDSERNCISNVHADGLSYESAAQKLEWLMSQARTLQLTGIKLKEDAPRDLDSAVQKHLDSVAPKLRSSEP